MSLRRIYLSTLCSIALGLLAAVATPAPQSDASGGHSPALSIDGTPVPWQEYAGWLVRVRGREALNQFALHHELERQATAEGIALSEAELRATIERQILQRVEGAFQGDHAKWAAELALQKLTPDTYRKQRLNELRFQRLTEELVQKRRVLDEQTLEQAWEREYGPAGQTLHVSRLFLRVRMPEQPAGATRDEVLEMGRVARAECLERAQSLLTQLEAGASFSALAREHSDDADTAAQGGRMAQPFQPESWPGISAEPLLGAEQGAWTVPLFSRGGYNIFRIDSRQVHPFDEVRARVAELARKAPVSAGESAALNQSLLSELRIEVLPEMDRTTSAQDARLERPVCTLGTRAITRREFAEWLLPARGRSMASAFVDRKLIQSLAERAGVSVTRIEIETRMAEDIANQVELFHQGDREAWLADLAGKGGSEADFQRKAQLRVSHSLLAEKLLLRERVVSEEMIERAWIDRYGAGGRSLDVRLIMRNLPEPPEGALQTQEQLERYVEVESAKALELLSKLRARASDGEDFSALARTYSQDPRTRDLGGRGPQRFELHRWPLEVQELLRALKPGEVSQPYELSRQFFLFELAGIVVVELDEVREELALELQRQRPSQVEVAGFVNARTRELDVQILPGMQER